MIQRVADTARSWFIHYGPQDLAAALAAVLGAFVLAPFDLKAPVVAAVCACLEWIVFYGVAYERNRRLKVHISPDRVCRLPLPAI